MRPDGRNVVERARKEASEYLKNFAIPISGRVNQINILPMSEYK